MKDSIEQWVGTLFGLIFLSLSFFVTVETVARKAFNASLQGADEVGGYSLAVGATLAFSLAVIGRMHVRVDVFHTHLSARAQSVLNWLSAVSLAAFASLMAWLAWFVLQDSHEYQSVAQTPWATPLIYPQAAWLFGLVVFALVSLGYALRATALLFRGKVEALNHELGPRSTKEEVAEELDDLKVRGSGTSDYAPTTVRGAGA